MKKPNGGVREMKRPVPSRIPQGVGAPPPPGMDPRKGKLMCIKVRMLDDSVAVFHLGHKATGQALFDEVCRHLNLLESDYFGLEFIDEYGNHCWLEKDKSILRQITSTHSDARFYFIVKFYVPNPADLEEEYTRYLLSQQIRRDLAKGELICNENTAALLVSFIVQAEVGDFSPEDYPDHTYLSSTQFIPNQTAAFQVKVMENHKKLIAMSPSEADFALLETARRCDFYGIKLHPAKDIEGTDVSLSLAHMGIRVFHELTCVTTFSWAKIRKLSFKRKRLMIKLHPESYQYYKETIEFSFENRNDCKNFWKKAVEHHAFFRCSEAPEPRKEPKIFARGSSFRYRGRTQKQLIDYVREHRKRREPFQRPLRPSSTTRAESTLRRNFNVIDATSYDGYATVNRTGTVSDDERLYSARYDRSTNAPVYYPDTAPVNGSARSRPKSVHQSQPSSARESDGRRREADRNCVSDLESSMVEGYPPFSHALSARPSTRDEEQEKRTSDRRRANGGVNGHGHVGADRNGGSAVDPMSLSLPNVLADDIKVVAQSDRHTEYPKSASGDNFMDQLNAISHEAIDNVSEGSYRLGDEHASSSSDVGASHNGVSDPRVFTTTFTAKRVGNVVVKRVTTSTAKGQRRRGSADDDDSSSCSDYARGSSVSAPAASKTTTRRPTPSNSRPSLSMLRDAVPIPIDGPDSYPNRVGTANVVPTRRVVPTTSAVPVNIIRPVVISKDEPSTSTSSRPLQTIAPLAQAESVSPGPSDSSRYASVVKPNSTFDPSGIVGSTFSPVVEQSHYSSFQTVKSNRDPSAGPIVIPTSSTASVPSSVPTYGASGPIPGKVIHKENMVITPEGITVRSSVSAARKDKPAVPPKPKNIVITQQQVQMIDIETQSPPPTRSPPSVAPKPTLTNISAILSDTNDDTRKLLEPLDSILKDASDLSSILSTGSMRKKSDEDSQKSTPRDRPTLISVESEDRPDVKKLHLFGSEIPYTLTLRNLETAPPSSSVSNIPNAASASSPSPSVSQERTVSEPGMLRAQSKRNADINKHRKSFDLVQRKRLPSHESYSSQDHSISPTTPETGNVVEYVMRRRSLSTDRHSIGSGSLRTTKKRNELRRQTQPVRFATPDTSASSDTNVAEATQKHDVSKDAGPKVDAEPAAAPQGAAAQAHAAVVLSQSVTAAEVHEGQRRSSETDSSEMPDPPSPDALRSVTENEPASEEPSTTHHPPVEESTKEATVSTTSAKHQPKSPEPNHESETLVTTVSGLLETDF